MAQDTSLQVIITYICQECNTQESAEKLIYSLLSLPHELP